jgi:hypothetical protein
MILITGAMWLGINSESFGRRTCETGVTGSSLINCVNFFAAHVRHFVRALYGHIPVSEITSRASSSALPITTISPTPHINRYTQTVPPRPSPLCPPPLSFTPPSAMDRFLAPHSPEAQAHSLVTLVSTLMPIYAHD